MSEIQNGIETSNIFPRDFKGVWIPREVWLDDRLSALDKIILVEIDSLDCDEKGCYASNKYLAEFCQCSEAKITKSISKLVKFGYLEVVGFNGRCREIKSLLSKIRGSLVKSTRQTSKKYEADSEKVRGSILINNIDNNIDNYLKKKTKKEKSSKRENKSPCTKIPGGPEENFRGGTEAESKKQDTENLYLEKKSSKKETPLENQKSFNEMIDSYTSNLKLRHELKEHLKVRKAKKALSSHALELSLDRLEKIASSDEEKIAIVQNSIIGGWTRFYELKADEKKRVDKPSYDLSKYDDNFTTFSEAEKAYSSDDLSKYDDDFTTFSDKGG